MHKWFLGLGVSIALLVVVMGVAASNYQAVQPINGWYGQAYSAADAEQMAEWLDKLLAEMRNLGMVEGHYALIFPNPHNDVALDIEVFEALRARCDEVAEYPKGSMDYAESLEDIRRQMDKTDFDPWWWMMVHKANLAAWLIFTSIPWFIGVFFGIGIGGDALSDYLDERRHRKWLREREEKRKREIEERRK